MGYLWEYPKIKCPDNCRYRDKKAPFCGYCMMEIMRELGIRKKEDENGSGEEEQYRQVEDQGLGEA